MNPLERRYRKLLLAYPARYRAERGEEIVDTYLALAGPGRRWPSPADARDVLGGGLRQHVRAARSIGLTAGVPAAALFATAAAATLAAAWLLLVEVSATSPDYLVVRFGPFLSLGAAVWIGWLVAGAAALMLPGRAARGAVLAALVLTVAVVPVAALTPYARPPLMALVPQAALGVVALGLSGRAHRGVRLGVALTVVTAVAVAAAHGPASAFGYHHSGTQLLSLGGVLLLAGGLAVAVLLRSVRGVSAVLLLLPATALLLNAPLARAATTSTPGWSTHATMATGTTALTGTALGLAAAAYSRRARRRLARPADGPNEVVLGGSPSGVMRWLVAVRRRGRRGGRGDH